jgi:hypothetical protein
LYAGGAVSVIGAAATATPEVQEETLSETSMTSWPAPGIDQICGGWQGEPVLTSVT